MLTSIGHGIARSDVSMDLIWSAWIGWTALNAHLRYFSKNHSG
jgi:hypothetical protein